MKTRNRGVGALAGLCLAVAGTTVAATDQHHAGHAHEPPAKLELDHGKPWATDAPLRKGMGALHAAFAERVEAIHAGTLPAANYRALGAKVETEVAALVAECKLEPKADAVLHVIVAELLAAADVLQGRAPGTPAAGAHRAVAALNDYGRKFDHPQWQPLQ
jgi:hypothetical protein